MNDCRQLHETVVKDIVDVIGDIKDFDQIDWINNKNSTGSIAKRASNLVLVFPVIVSNALSMETAMIINKAIERKCCSLLQILFSSMQFANSDNLIDYLRKFHTNLDLKSGMDLDEFLDIMDKMVDEGTVIVNKEMYESIKEDMHNIDYHLSTDFNPVSINDYKIVNNYFGESSVVCEADSRNLNTGIYDDKDLIAAMNKSINNRVDKSITKAFKKGITVNNNMGGKDRNMSAKDATDYFSKQLLDNDIKKANELMPTTMVVNFISTSDDGRNSERVTGVIGVKAKMYPVDSMDICNRLSSKIKDRNGLFNLVRASTREISFFKDLAFAIDKAKLDAVYMASDSNNARMFKVLERRAAKNKFSRLIKKNDASAITSLVLSQYEVEYLKQMNINIEKSYNARSILEAYNLMDIVIADESLEIAKFIFDDGDGVYEALTFDALEKQSNDNTYKKVVNLVSKINH